MAKKRKQDPVEPDPVEESSVTETAVAVLEEPEAEQAPEGTVVDVVTDEPSEVDPNDELKRVHYSEIVELHKKVREAEWDYATAKQHANTAKKSLEELQADLSLLIARGPKRPDPQRELPFGDDDSESDDEPNPDWWRDVSIRDVLDLTDKQYEKLDGAGIRTFGRFEDVRAGQDSDYPRGLRSIKGVGEKSVDEWEEAVLKWWGRHRQQAANQVADDPDEDDEQDLDE